MSVNRDSTSAYQVFNRLAQLQDETKKRLTLIDELMDKQRQNDAEFSEMEKIARAYLEPLGYPAVNARAYDLDCPYSTKDYTILMDDNETIVRPTIGVFSISPLDPDKIDAILKADGATESAFEMALNEAIEECELAREHQQNATLEKRLAEMSAQLTPSEDD